MNRCPEIELELAAFCSGELDPAERKLVQDHLNRCADCRAELAREMNLRATLGSLPRATAPAGLAERILEDPAPAAEHRSSRRTGRRRLAAMGLAAAGLAAVLLLPVLHTGPAPEQTWTDQEIAAARQEVLYTLALTAKVIDRTQRDTVIEIFADKLPHAIDESFKAIKPTTSGGNG
ncbi:MAG: zf-HC2 domain-containing protein [Candidatus Krumholzibacteriota bacterium]